MPVYISESQRASKIPQIIFREETEHRVYLSLTIAILLGSMTASWGMLWVNIMTLTENTPMVRLFLANGVDYTKVVVSLSVLTVAFLMADASMLISGSMGAKNGWRYLQMLLAGSIIGTGITMFIWPELASKLWSPLPMIAIHTAQISFLINSLILNVAAITLGIILVQGAKMSTRLFDKKERAS